MILTDMAAGFRGYGSPAAAGSAMLVSGMNTWRTPHGVSGYGYDDGAAIVGGIATAEVMGGTHRAILIGIATGVGIHLATKILDKFLE